MCWRDRYRPPSNEGILWNTRWSYATMVNEGDIFTFKQDEFGSGLVFHRIRKNGDDTVGIQAPRLKDGTKVEFTRGRFKGSYAVLKLSHSRSHTRFHFTNGEWFYPFQKRRGAPDPKSIRFQVVGLPTSFA